MEYWNNAVKSISSYYDQLWQAIIRPPRDVYTEEDLGFTKFALSDGRKYMRTDFEIINDRGQKLVASHFEPFDSCRPLEKLPCVIYLHGNCSSRLEAMCALPFLLPLNVTVVGLDFAGSGQSDGEYVTLGWYERDDLRELVTYLREKRRVSLIGLWGRSMGAVAGILYAAQDPTISGIVCDSPFSNLKVLAEELSRDIVPVPLVGTFVAGIMLDRLRQTIKSKANFDIYALDVKKCVAKCETPVMFISAMDDKFVRKHHGEILFNNYPGSQKWFIEAAGDHNSIRTNRVMNSIAVFLYNVLLGPAFFENAKLQDQRAWVALAQEASELSMFSSARMEHWDVQRMTEVATVLGDEDPDDEQIPSEVGEGSPAREESWGGPLRMQAPEQSEEVQKLRRLP